MRQLATDEGVVTMSVEEIMKNKTQAGLKILAAIYVLACLMTACNTQGVPDPVSPAEMPTSTVNSPVLLPSATATPLSPDAQALKDIVFSPCIPVEQSLPDDMDIPWDLLVMQGGALYILNPEVGTKVEVPYFSEKTPEGYNKFSYDFYVSPDGKWLAYQDTHSSKLFVEPAETLLTNQDTDRIVWEKDKDFC